MQEMLPCLTRNVYLTLLIMHACSASELEAVDFHA
jgi:hypothetical protein